MFFVILFSATGTVKKYITINQILKKNGIKYCRDFELTNFIIHFHYLLFVLHDQISISYVSSYT